MELENTGIMAWNQPAPPSNLPTEVEKSRAIAEVQAALVMAKHSPRNTFQAYTDIMKACERTSLAKSALYSYPRGGQTVTGPSIRLAEMMAQNWGNLETDIVILENLENMTRCMAYCWDLQTNYKVKRSFEVPHEIKLTNGKMKKLTDPRDIREYISNIGQRYVRQCILAVIPGDVREDAVDRCKQVLALGDKNDPLDARIKRILLAFKNLGVTQQMLETKLEQPITAWSNSDLAELQPIYNSIKDGADKADFFESKAGSSLDAMKTILGEEIPR